MSRVAVGTGTKKIPHCTKAVSAEYRSKFAALHQQLVASQYKGKILDDTLNNKQTNKTSLRIKAASGVPSLLYIY